MICFKDIQPTWNILEFDKGLDCTPTTTLSRYGKDPLDLDTAICFSFSGNDEEKEQIFYYLHTDITVNSKSYSSNSLAELFKSREPEIHVFHASSNMFSKTYVMPCMIEDQFVYRKIQITIVCEKKGTNYKCRMLPITEISRYVFYENGVVVENRDGSRVFTTPDKLIDDSLTTVLKSASQQDRFVPFQEFCEKARIPYKKEIVRLLKSRNLSYWEQEKPKLYFERFIRLYIYALEEKDKLENIPGAIINDLKCRNYNPFSSVRLYKDLIVITGRVTDNAVHMRTNRRIYADGNEYYFFIQNVVTGAWKRTDNLTELFETDYESGLYVTYVDKSLFMNTCLGRFVKYSIADSIPTKSKVDLYKMLVQREYLAAEQAAKVSKLLFDNILYTIYMEGALDKTEKLSDLLGLTGPQIKFFTEYDYRYKERGASRLNLVKFGKLMKSDGYITNYPEVKKRIFAVMMRLEYERRATMTAFGITLQRV